MYHNFFHDISPSLLFQSVLESTMADAGFSVFKKCLQTRKENCRMRQGMPGMPKMPDMPGSKQVGLEVVVKGLPSYCTEEDLYQLFSSYGEVASLICCHPGVF